MSETYVVVNEIVLVEPMDRNLLRTVENSRFAVEKVDRPVESCLCLTISPNVVFKTIQKIFRFSLESTGKFNKTSKIYSKNSQYQRPAYEQAHTLHETCPSTAPSIARSKFVPRVASLAS
jgi:hypothetical protein